MLRARVDGLAWVEVFEAGALVDADPPAAALRTAAALQALLGDGADFVVLREGGHSEVGMGCPRRSTWCHLGAAATLGGTLSALPGAAGLLRGDDPSGAPSRSAEPQWPVGAGGLLSSLVGFVARAQDVVAALVLTDAVDEPPVAGVGHVGLGAEVFGGIARRRHAGLDVELTAGRSEPRSMVTGERVVAGEESAPRGFWCFGARLAAPASGSLWLFLDRGSAQGLGWAYLSVCGRQIADAIVSDSRGE